MAADTQNRASRRPEGRQIGYARVSTDEQTTEAQEMELRSAGCDRIVQEHGSGASRARPALSRLVREIGAGDTESGGAKFDHGSGGIVRPRAE
ncbi:putative site-specific integrase-resolvase [Mesorhizobium sp. BE184]|nr:putative site-specific integrase-resolvase [Mesorhizobium sp. BE184]